MNSAIQQSFAFPSANTQTAGTAITQVIPGRGGKRIKLRTLRYTSLATQHTLTLLTPLAPAVRVTANANSGQAVIVLASDPGVYVGKTTANNPIGVSDWLVIENATDGLQTLVQVHGSTAPVTNADGTVTVTLIANLSAAVPAGSFAFFLGALTDVNPLTGAAHQTIAPPTGATTDYPLNASLATDAVAVCPLIGGPMVIHSGNATNAGIIANVAGTYGP